MSLHVPAKPLWAPLGFSRGGYLRLLGSQKKTMRGRLPILDEFILVCEDIMMSCLCFEAGLEAFFHFTLFPIQGKSYNIGNPFCVTRLPRDTVPSLATLDKNCPSAMIAPFIE